MHTNHIAADSTLSDIWHLLSKPDDFVSDVMGKMHAYRKAGEGVLVRLGVTGTGQKPNYRLEDAHNQLPSIAYNGTNHAPFPDEEQVASTKTWSSETMTYRDLVDLRKAHR